MAWERFVAAFDVHGDQQDKQAVEKFSKFIKQWKPRHRIMGGDLYDFRPLRRKAGEDEKRESMVADYNAGNRFFEDYKPTVYLLGNHCARLFELAESDNGIVSDFARQGVAEINAMAAKHKCPVLPYHKRDGVFRMGHLKVIHGFHSGIYATRQTALIYGSCLMGHIHVVDEHAIPGLERRVARACGCLCKLDMDYNSRTPMTLRQSHGFAFGVINQRTGAYHVWQAEEVNGKWMVPTDIVEL